MLRPLLLGAALLAHPALSCGGFFCTLNQPVVQAGEVIAFGVKDAGNGAAVRVAMHVQIMYDGPSEDFSWVLPTPFLPDLSVGSDVLFGSLFALTRPDFIFTVKDDDSKTCTNDMLMGNELCPARGADEGAEDDGAVVLEEGSVGPFDFKIIESADGDPTSVFRWLTDNEYDQPEGAEDLINYYAGLDHKFVALRLRKDTGSGEIQPLILEYDMPGADVKSRPFACVPIQLTSIAATVDMPIQVYLLGEARGFPVNYFEVDLDDALADWIGCRGSQNCYLNDMRARFAAVAAKVHNHTFVTEYAGPSAIVAGGIELSDANADELSGSSSPFDFLSRMATMGVPSIKIVNAIIEKWIPGQYSESVPGWCTNLYTPFRSWMMEECIDHLEPPLGWAFNATGLADELDDKVFVPAAEAQAWVDSHPYLTRLYTQLSPANMNRDPFFGFNGDLPDVDRLHNATAAPVCKGGEVTGLNITVRGGGTFFEPATLGCFGWQRTSGEPLFGTGRQSTASRMAVHGYEGEEGRVLTPSADGEFLPEEVEEAVQFMDSRVVDQAVVSDSRGDNATAAPGVSAAPTKAPTDDTPTMPPTGESPTSAAAELGGIVVISVLWASAGCAVF